MFVDWPKIIESSLGPLLGTLIGGGIAIGGILIKEFFDRRRAVQAWFIEHYISEGFDEMISYFFTAQFYLSTMIIEVDVRKSSGVELPILTAEFRTIPWEALNRVGYVLLMSEARLLGCLTATAPGIEIALRLKTTGAATKATVEATKTIVAFLIDLRDELIKVKLKRREDLRHVFMSKPIKLITGKYKEKLLAPKSDSNSSALK